jgi:SepF-like predicted cell division protein (DUF552 family)
MGIFSRLTGEESSSARKTPAAQDYIDLSDYAASEKTGEGAASTYVRFAELRALDDLKHFSAYVYDGNMLILDFKAVQGDEVTLRRLTNELRKIAQDTGGDISGLGDHHILLTPTGIKVDRRTVKVNKETGETEVRAAAAPAPAPAPRGPPPAPRAEPPATVPTWAQSAAASGSPPQRPNGRRPSK